MAGERADDFLVGVECDVKDKGQLGLLRGIEHIQVQRVAVQDAGARPVAGDKMGAVVGQNGLRGRNPRQDALAAAGKPGEEMRLDEAFRDQQVGPVDQIVQPEGAARRQVPLKTMCCLSRLS
jgi:hypothetical protein